MKNLSRELFYQLQSYIQKYKIVYTMNHRDQDQNNNQKESSKKKKVLPIKLREQVYQDLKLVSKETDRSMAEIIRTHFVKPVLKQASQIRAKQGKSKLSLSQHLRKYAYKGRIYHQDKTDDELLYFYDQGLEAND
jgi:hypothetical protein